MTQALIKPHLSSRTRWSGYPRYKESKVGWLGRIPQHWSDAPLYARYQVQLGKMLDEKRITGDNLAPYVRNVDVQWDRVNVNELPEMDFTRSDRARFLLKPGDLLVCEGGEVGRAAVWQGELAECYYQKAIHRLRPFSDKESPRFLFYLLHAVAKLGVFVAEGNPNTIDHLTAEKLRKHRFPFPSPSEQHSIVRFLDRETAKIDALIAKKQRLIELLQEKRSALISHAVTKGLDPRVQTKESGIEWLGMIPANWERIKFRHCVDVAEGQVDPKDDRFKAKVLIAPNHIESGTGRLLLTETADGQGAISGKYSYRSGDVVYSKIRPELRKACIPSMPGLCSADMYPLSVRRKLVAKYLLYTLLSEYFTQFTVVISERVAMPKVNREDLGECYLLIPPVREQEEIVGHIEAATGKLDALTAKVIEGLERLREYRTALISAAVTGKFDVREEVPYEPEDSL